MFFALYRCGLFFFQAPLFSSCDLLGFSNPLYCRAWDFYGAGREGRTESQAMAAAELRCEVRRKIAKQNNKNYIVTK